MAEIRRTQRLIESVDPVTGQTVYTDEVTGEVVTPGSTIVTPEATVVSTGGERQTTQVTEYVTEPGTTVAPASGQVVTQRTVSTPAAPVATHTQESQVYTDDPYEHRRARAYRLQQAIYLVFGILEGLLAIRFVLQLLGANPNSGFAAFIYGITAPFMAPFAGVFGEPSVGGSVIEWNTLVAMVVYALLAWVLAKVAWLVAGETRSGVRTSRVNTRIDQ